MDQYCQCRNRKCRNYGKCIPWSSSSKVFTKGSDGNPKYVIFVCPACGRAVYQATMREAERAGVRA